MIQKATYREILGLTEFTAGQVNLCATTGRSPQKDESETLPAVGHISGNKKTRKSLNSCSDKVTTKRRVSITSFAPITTTKQTTTAAATAKPVTTSTTTRSRNYYKVAIKDFRAKMQRNIKPNFKSEKEKSSKKTFTPSARSSILAPISKSPKISESGNRSNSPASFP